MLYCFHCRCLCFSVVAVVDIAVITGAALLVS